MSKSFIYKADNKMRKIIFFIIIAVALYSCKQGNEKYIIQGHIINEAVYASGEVFPERYYFLKSSKTAPILQILVREGDFVTAGDLLVIMGSSDEAEKIRFASGQVAIARENASEGSAILKEIRNKMDIAERQYQIDKENAERYLALSQNKAVSQIEAENKSHAADRSLSEVNALREQYAATKKQLDNQLMTVELQLANISQQYNDNAIRSNISGKVYSILKRQGEIAGSDTPILMVGVVDAFKLELSIDERDISKIEIGQKVYFETNTYPDRQFEAIISTIDPVMRKESRYFKVEAIVSGSTFFYPQSTVEASIVIRENVEALLIPFDYLHKDSVLLSESENRMVSVRTGIRLNDWIEVKAGINKGDIILKPINQ